MTAWNVPAKDAYGIFLLVIVFIHVCTWTDGEPYDNLYKQVIIHPILSPL